MKIIYEANDGKQFKTEKECRKYESNLEDNKKAEQALSIIKEICNKYSDCLNCPFEILNTGCVFEIGEFSHPYELLDYFKGQ